MPVNWMIWYYQVLDQASKITVSWRTLDLHWIFDLSTALSFATASFQQVELVPRFAKVPKIHDTTHSHQEEMRQLHFLLPQGPRG